MSCEWREEERAKEGREGEGRGGEGKRREEERGGKRAKDGICRQRQQNSKIDWQSKCQQKTLGRMNNLQYLKFLITIPCPIHKIDLAYRCTLSDLQFVDPSAGEELNHSMEYSNELLPTTCRIGSVKASG